MLWAFLVVAGATVAAQAGEGDGPWSGTLYIGPSTTKFFVPIVFSVAAFSRNLPLGLGPSSADLAESRLAARFSVRRFVISWRNRAEFETGRLAVERLSIIRRRGDFE